MPTINELPQTAPETATLLWENSNPSASFASQTITLSDTIENYKKLRIEVYRSSENYNIDFDMTDPSDFNGSSSISRMSICAKSADNTNIYARYMYFNGGYNKLYFSNGTRVGGTNTSGNICKPAKIYGIK